MPCAKTASAESTETEFGIYASPGDAATRANNRIGLEYLQNAFARMGLEYIPSHANFVMVRVGVGVDAKVFAELQKRGVITDLTPLSPSQGAER